MDALIVVVLDEAIFADGALDKALDLAARGAAITVIGLHVINVVMAGAAAGASAWLGGEPSVVPPEVAAWHEARAAALGARFVAACAARGLPHQLRVETGAWADRVHFHGQAADLVVLARPSSALDEEEAVGEGADLVPAVLAGLRGAVLVVPPGAPAVQRIVLGWEPCASAQRALQVAARLALATRLPLEVTVVADRPDPNVLVPLREHLGLLGLNSAVQVIPGEVWEALTASAAAGPPAIVAVGASDKSRLGRWIWGSTPDNLLNSTDLCVLVVG